MLEVTTPLLPGCRKGDISECKRQSYSAYQSLNLDTRCKALFPPLNPSLLGSEKLNRIKFEETFTEIFVATSIGNDDSYGLNRLNPLKTLERALEVAKDYQFKKIILLEDYHVQNTLIISKEHSNLILEGEKSIIDGRFPRISATVSISNCVWTYVNFKMIKCKLDKTILPLLGPFSALFVNRSSAIRARYPNENNPLRAAFSSTKPKSWGKGEVPKTNKRMTLPIIPPDNPNVQYLPGFPRFDKFLLGFANSSGNSFEPPVSYFFNSANQAQGGCPYSIPKSATFTKLPFPLANITAGSSALFHAVHLFGWGVWSFYISSLNQKQVTFGSGGWQEARGDCGKGGKQWMVENALEFLDSPNEYYLDMPKGELYYYPPDTNRNPIINPQISMELGTNVRKIIEINGEKLISSRPTRLPTTAKPTTGNPTSQSPTISPSSSPQVKFTKRPTTSAPSRNPSRSPKSPSKSPTKSKAPTKFPSQSPTSSLPTRSPSKSRPTFSPSASPIRLRPTAKPSAFPTRSPSISPSTSQPSFSPIISTPSKSPASSIPTKSPTRSPIFSPSKSPTLSRPSSSPTTRPTLKPTTGGPSRSPSNSPKTRKPSLSPSKNPTRSIPTRTPTRSPKSQAPSKSPSRNPTRSRPTRSPTKSPKSQFRSQSPSKTPTKSFPTKSPSKSPQSQVPSGSPSKTPTRSIPTRNPSFSPKSQLPSPVPTIKPSTSAPTKSPTNSNPTKSPTQSPNDPITLGPTSISMSPSKSPTLATPSETPSQSPSYATPTKTPTTKPTLPPSPNPTHSPSSTKPTTSPLESIPTSSPSTSPETTILGSNEEGRNLINDQNILVQNVWIRNVEFFGAYMTTMDPFEVPSGGDWTIHRSAALHIENAENVVVEDTKFTWCGGNGLIISKSCKNINVTMSEFYALGASGIIMAGDPGYENPQPWIITDFPQDIYITNNLIHHVGLHVKQSGPIFITLSKRVNLLDNIFFSGPRAGITMNDQFGQGHYIKGNVVFDMVRETRDNGPFIVWHRQPYAEGITDPDIIEHNLFAGHDENVEGNKGINLDDGVFNIIVRNNIILWGTQKLKGSKVSIYGNLIVHPPWRGCTVFSYFTRYPAQVKFYDNICFSDLPPYASAVVENMGSTCIERENYLAYQNTFYYSGKISKKFSGCVGLWSTWIKYQDAGSQILPPATDNWIVSAIRAKWADIVLFRKKGQ